MTIIDFSTARPPVSVLKAAGVTTVMRYIGWDGVGIYPNTGKNLTEPESALYLANNISIGICFEYIASAAALGVDQGEKDAQLANQQMEALKAPVGTGVYFAVDYDTPDYAPTLPNIAANARAKLGPIGDYFAAIERFGTGYRAGVYGGYWVVKRLLDAGLVKLAWQTVAWSGGNVDPRINLLQTTQKSPIADSDFNIHEGKSEDFGQWPLAAAPPPVTPPATPKSITVAIPPGVKTFTITWS